MYTEHTAKMIEDLADEALNAACRLIQDRLAITTGDVAGVVFSGPSGARIRAAFVAYIRTELHIPDIAEPGTVRAALTADTITDDQIRELRADVNAGGVYNSALDEVTYRALGPDCDDLELVRAARASCAEILNARTVR